MSWNLVRLSNAVMKTVLFPEQAKPRSIGPTEFETNARKAQEKVGRAWKPSELRLKSHLDLHKLWYVLLKEKLALQSDKYYCIRMKSRFFGNGNLYKVKLSMARLLTVVHERAIVANNFRSLLEDKYIMVDRFKKEASEDSLENFPLLEPEANILQLPAPEKEKSSPIGPAKENQEIEDAKLEKTKRDLGVFPPSQTRFKTKDSPLSKRNKAFFLRERRKMPQKRILEQYVRNWRELSVPQRKIVLSKVNALRSKNAKEIILKELYAIAQSQKHKENNEMKI